MNGFMAQETNEQSDWRNMWHEHGGFYSTPVVFKVLRCVTNGEKSSRRGNGSRGWGGGGGCGRPCQDFLGLL